MANYHINRSTGRVNICQATVQNCPIGGEHFSDKIEARRNAERIMEQEHDQLSSFSKSSQEVAQSESQPYSYALTPKLEKLIRQRLNNYMLRSEMKNLKIDENLHFTVVLGSSSRDIAANIEDEHTQEFFSRGKCGYIAHELHIITGKPMAIFTDTTSEGSWVGHAALQLENGTYLDIRGIHTEDQIRRYYNLKEYTVENDVSSKRFKELLNRGHDSIYGDREDLEKTVIEKLSRDLQQVYLIDA